MFQVKQATIKQKIKAGPKLAKTVFLLQCLNVPEFVIPDPKCDKFYQPDPLSDLRGAAAFPCR